MGKGQIMAKEASGIVLDAHQETLYDEMCQLIDGAQDGIDLMTRTQDLVDLLLKRAGDHALRDQSLGEISRFFLGMMRASDLSDEYRMRKLRLFAKQTVKLMIGKRAKGHADGIAPPPGGVERRGKPS
jgi:hypothetical protein